MKETLSYYSEKLQELKNNSAFRYRKNIEQDSKYIVFKGKKVLNLSSNDYLGISADNNIKDNFLSSYKGKIQNPSARLLTGENKAFFELEELLKNALDKEDSLLFNSGYHANVGIYSALLNKEDVVFVDKLNHASIIDGIRLSGAKLIPFNHCDYSDLEYKLKKYRNSYKKSIISSESLFSMDGDFSDTKKLTLLKEKYNSLLIIDEAHSFGVYGNGLGYCKEKGNLKEVDLIMGTFGKAIGSYGAFAAGDKTIIDYLVNHSRSFIFSTALPEISVSFSKFVLENYILNSNKLQDKLFKIMDFAQKELTEFKHKKTASYIIPVILGENKTAEKVSDKLIENGFYTLPIRYPTVKKGEARIRISLNPLITEEEISALKTTVKNSI